MPQPTSVAAFTAVLFFGLLCWLFSIVQAIGIWQFWPWAYRSGLRIFVRPLPKPAIAFSSGAAWNTPDVKATAIDGQEILFRAPMPVFEFRVHTPFPILGTATLSSATFQVTARIPPGPAGFLVAWVLGWTIGGIAEGMTNALNGLGTAALGWVFGAGFAAFCISLELVRFRRAQDSLVALLSGSPPNNRWRGP
jgi:hypothetical protein